MCAASISDTVIGTDLMLTKVNIYKVTPSGEILWSKTVGDKHLWNKVHGIYPDHNEGYIMCGFRHDDVYGMDWMNSSGWICKIDEEGDSLWWREYEHFDDPEWHMNKFYDLHLTSDGGYIAVGQTATFYEPQQAWLMKVDSFGCDTPGCQSVGIIEPHNISKEIFLIYPNPSSEKINCKFTSDINRNVISIFNLYGMKQDEVVIPKNQNQIQIDVSKYPSGVYVAILKDERKIIAQRKFIVK